MRKEQKTIFLSVSFVLLQDLLYGFGDPISKLAYDRLPVFSLLCIRFWIAAAVLLALFGKKTVRQLRRCHWRALLPPCLCIAGTYLLNNLAISMTAATSVAFLRSMSIVITPLMALVFLRKKYSWKHLPVLAVVLLGLYLLCGFGGLSAFGKGEVLTLLASALMAGALVFAGSAMEEVSATTLTTVQSLSSALLATVVTFAAEGGVHLENATVEVWLIIVYLAILCTLAGYLLQNLALRSLSAGTVSLLQCACPVMTALFSYFILREHLTAAGVGGAALIVIGVAAETLLSRREETAGFS